MKKSYIDPLDHLRELLPSDQELFSIRDVANILNKSEQFVRDAIKNKKILGYALKARTINSSQNRCSYLIHKDDLVMYLLNHANYTAREYKEQIIDLIARGTRTQLKCFLQEITNRLSMI